MEGMSLFECHQRKKEKKNDSKKVQNVCFEKHMWQVIKKKQSWSGGLQHNRVVLFFVCLFVRKSKEICWKPK